MNKSRRTTVPHAGDSSQSWDLTAKLGEFCEKPQYGYTASASREKKDCKFLRITDLQEQRIDWNTVPWCEASGDDIARYGLAHGDVLVARIGATTGSTAIVVDPPVSVFASYLIRLRPAQSLNPFFLYFYTKSRLFLDWIEAHKDSNLKGGVNVPVLLDAPIQSPKKQDQEKIAAVLWKLQRAIIIQDKVIAATRDLTQSAMQRLFTHGLRGEPLHSTKIGPMPESWRPRSIPELCDIQSGGTPRKSVPEYWKGDIPWVSGKDLKSPSLDDAIDHISLEGVASGSRLAPKDSVLLLVRGMGLAKDLPVTVITRPMAFNQDIKALVTKGEYSGSFIRSAIYAGKQRLINRIVPSAHGTMTLNLDDVQSFFVACPTDPNEAREIAAALSTIDRKLAHHQRKRAALDALFQTTLHELMTGHIRVAGLDIDTSEVATPTLQGEAA